MLDEDVILEYFYQVFLSKDKSEQAKAAASVMQNPEVFYLLWQSYLNEETLGEISLKRASLFTQVQKEIALSWLPAKQALSFLGGGLLPVGLIPLPALRSAAEPLYQKGEFIVKSELLPKVSFQLVLKAHAQGVELDLGSKSRLPSWLIVKLKKGEEFKELQNFTNQSCQFFIPNPRGKWALFLADAKGKKGESFLVEIQFKK